MTSKNTFGKIFKVKAACPGSDKVKTLSALAVSDINSSSSTEFLPLITTRKESSKTAVPVKKSDISKGSLPAGSFLSIDGPFMLDASTLSGEIAEMKSSFMDMVIRAMIKDRSRLYYEKFHKPKQQEPFIPGKSRINYAGRVFDEKELLGLIDSSLDFWLTTGKYADKFEKDFAKFLGVKHCSLTNSGSSANLLAFMALTSPKLGEKKISRGDEVITLAAGFPTTIAPIIQYGAVPVFIDITLPSYNIDVSMLEKAMSKKTKAVMIAHTLGNPFDLKAIKDFCDRHGLWLIEDNCDALGARYLYKRKWRYTGTIGHIGTSSFYPPHHMTMGEGGAVYTNDTLLKRIIESFRDWGRDCWCASGKDDTCKKRFKWQLGELPYGYDHKYIYSHFGYNLKVTDMQAAIGCTQLDKLTGFIEGRNRNWNLLREGLDGAADIFILPEPTENSEPSWFGFLLTLNEGTGISREALVNHLESNGIQTRMLFGGNLLKHPCFDEMRETKKGYRVVGNLTNTDRVMRDTFWIGVYPGMKAGMIDFMIEQILNFIKK